MTAVVSGTTDSVSRILGVTLGELRILSRGRWWWIVRFLFALSLVLGVYSAWPSAGESAREMSRFGATLFRSFFHVAYLAVLLLTPAIFGRVVASGKLNQTAGLLLSTPIRSGEVVAGKFISHYALILVLLACGVPILFSSLLFGGVSGTQVLLAGVSLLLVAFLAGGLTTLFSTLLRKPYQASLLTYVVGIGLMFVSTWIATMVAFSTMMGGGAQSAWMELMWLFAPHAVLAALPLEDSIQGAGILWIAVIESILLGGLFLILSSLLLRRMVLHVPKAARAKARDLPRRPAASEIQRSRTGPGTATEPPKARRWPPPGRVRPYKGPVWKNPVAWKEFNVRRGLAGTVAVLLGVVLLVLTVGLVGFTTLYGFSNEEGFKPLYAIGIIQVTALIGEVVLLGLLTASLSGSSMGEEREGGNLDLLAATPMTASQIWFGKFTGIQRTLAPFWVFLAIHFLFSLVAVALFVPEDRAIFVFLAPLFLMLFVAFVTSLGLLLSLFGRSSTMGVTLTLGALVLWWIIVPILMEALDLPMQATAAGANPFVAAVGIAALSIPESEDLIFGSNILETLKPIVTVLVFLSAGSFLSWLGFTHLFDRRTGRTE
jgi:ABC-type transport system involved in multi-copper enzyme maturation permease subunit